MKTILAKEKSEYSHCLINFINLKLNHKVRYANYSRMRELEKIIKEKGDEIQIIITTKNTNELRIAPAMTMENIKN